MVLLDPLDDFFGIKKKSDRPLAEAVKTEGVAWKDIKPDNSFMTIRKMHIQDQKKRKYQEMQRQRQEMAAATAKIHKPTYSPYKKAKFNNGEAGLVATNRE